ncbi:hypothetical protein HK153_07100 [Streptococcus agalactiae]|nr:hypothetical protein [Streptococcus agalactiae]MCC9885372.1 hypothetical protein [Streptococcus agalactiae]
METCRSNTVRRWILSLQRNGRLIRQGNMHQEVDIYHYITKGSFDNYLWVRHEVA